MRYGGKLMEKHTLKYNFLLLLAAAIWGFAFVAQRVGAAYVGAFTFNGIRFALGSLPLIPLLIHNAKKPELKNDPVYKASPVLGGVIAGAILFAASTFQQYGLCETTAGKAAFITGLYIVIVPILGIFLKHRTTLKVWLGAGLAVTGLFFLCVTRDFTVSGGDLLELASAILFAFHIHVIGHFSQKVDAIKLSLTQFVTCAALSLIAAGIFDRIEWQSILAAGIPLLYGGLCSVGIAYTLQVVGQKHARPATAAIILNMETLFAAVGGMLLLGETMSLRGYAGCALMLAGMLLSQIKTQKKEAGIGL